MWCHVKVCRHLQSQLHLATRPVPTDVALVLLVADLALALVLAAVADCHPTTMTTSAAVVALALHAAKAEQSPSRHEAFSQTPSRYIREKAYLQRRCPVVINRGQCDVLTGGRRLSRVKVREICSWYVWCE